MLEKLRDMKVYTGRWWNSVLKNVPEDSFEAFLSLYMLPLPIDQRYGNNEIKTIHKIVCENMNN